MNKEICECGHDKVDHFGESGCIEMVEYEDGNHTYELECGCKQFKLNGPMKLEGEKCITSNTAPSGDVENIQEKVLKEGKESRDFIHDRTMSKKYVSYGTLARHDEFLISRTIELMKEENFNYCVILEDNIKKGVNAEWKEVVKEIDFLGYVKEINHFSNKELNEQIRKDLFKKMEAKE